MALNHTEYLVDALEELRRNANVKLKESRKITRKAGRETRAGYHATANTLYRRAETLENEARHDLEQIQRILADPTLNR